MNNNQLMQETIEIDGICTRIPMMISNDESNSFPLFHKPEWMPDEGSISCMKCLEKFTHFKRKHHCRSCGKIFCNKCCFEKVSLPHLGMKDPQKVCGDCIHISKLIIKFNSSDESGKREALFGMLKLIDSPELHKVVECGGLHFMMLQNLEDDPVRMEVIASALHILSQQIQLNKFLVRIGALKTLKSILTAGSEYHHLLNDSLSAFYLLCKDPEIRNVAIKEKLIEPILVILNIPGTASTLAAKIMLLILNNLDIHEILIQSFPEILQSLFKALQVEDYQMQGVITKMLVVLSAGSDVARQLLVMEDEKHGFPLKYLLKGASSSIVLLNAACVIANVAVVQKQDIGYHYLEEMCNLLAVLQESPVSENLISQLLRGLANFAEIKSNHDYLLPHMSVVVNVLLRSREPEQKYHICRLILSVIASIENSDIFLYRDGVREFMDILLNLPGVYEFLNTSLLRKVSKLSMCSGK